MNTNTTPEPDDIHLDVWITRQVQDLTNHVSDHLDLSAGLQDAQLTDRARTLDSTLDEVLDIETGLQAILGRDSHPRQKSAPAGIRTPTSPGSLASYAGHLTRLPANERLMLRTPSTLLILGLIRTLAALRVVPQHLIATRDPAVASDLAVDVNHVLGVALSRTLDLMGYLARAVALERAHAHALALDLALDRARVRDLDLARALDLARDRDLPRNLARDLDLIRDRNYDRDLPRDLARDLNLIRDRDYDRARDCARALTNALSHTLATREYANAPALDPDLASALLRDVLHFSTYGEYARLVSKIENVEAVIADFTTADLTDLDLQGIDLRGVRWSILTTRWPPEWEPFIREASVQIDPDESPDLYEVRDEPHVRHNVHMP